MFTCRLVIFLMIFTCSAAYGSERLIIDSFEYDQSLAMQSIWKSQDGSLPVEFTFHSTDQDEQALLLRCNFSQKVSRCHWDREVGLDLSRFGRFSLWVYAENPRAVRSGTLYFASDGGWFSAEITVGREGWRQVSLWKSNFRIEGSPAGWDSIKRIRLAFWNANDTDTIVGVDDLEAITDEIMIVLDDATMRKNSPEARSVREFTNSMARVLEDSGLEFGVVSNRDVESGVLSTCKLAIFPYNPEISEKEYEMIEKFVKSGGKFMLFYLLPERLAKLLGIESAGWAREKYPGQFFSIRLDVDAVEGSPEVISQGSWNVMIPKPRDPETKVIGEWVDAEDKRTGLPAITIGTYGAFMGHVLMPSDAINKRQMMLALFGKLVPDMRSSLSRAVLQRSKRIPGFAPDSYNQGFSKVFQFVTDNAVKIPRLRGIEALEHLIESKRLLILAEQAADDNQYGETLKIARRATEELQEAILYSFPSVEGEFRAVWCHSAFGIPGWDWDKAIGWLKGNGFNTIVPNMLRAGITYYPSEVLPVAQGIDKKSDQIALCLEACRKHGVQIHVWKVNWNLAGAPGDFVDRMRKEDRLQKDRWGKEVDWLCPSDPKNLELELESMLEIVRKYGVDGIHFDYIRYPHGNSCYCDNCKKRFEESIGAATPIQNWPEEVITGAYAENFTQWRCDQITRLVQSVSEQARKINPKIKISAAVFSDYPGCRRSVGQDWKLWVEKGYLDFVCPMDYTADNDRFKNLVANQVEIVSSRVRGSRISLYPGIGASAPGLSPEQVAMQAHLARILGADGFIVFNYDRSTARDVLPALFKGITSE